MYMFSKVNQMFGTKNSKINRLKRPSDTKKMNRVQNIQIKIWKYKPIRKYKI